MPSSHHATFSTSARHAASPLKKKTPDTRGGPPKVGGLKLNIKKKGRERNDKPPPPGMRKALRKQVILTNSNALVVPGLEELSASNSAAESSRGRVLAFSSSTIDSLRAVNAFKPRQGWNFFRRPAALMRRETFDIAQDMDKVDKSKGAKTVRRILTGERSSGKSTLLLQAMAMAFLKGWIVISIPEAQDLVNGNTDYAPLPNTSPTQYVQKTYVQALLAQIAKANEQPLSQMTLSLDDHQLPLPVQSNIALDRFCAMGASDPEVAWPFFLALWRELTVAGGAAKRPPVLLAIDDVHHVMRHSKYMSADYKPVHAHDLALVSWFMSHLGGSSGLASGGMVLAATSESNRPASESLDFAIRQSEFAQAANSVVKGEEPVWNPYKELDAQVMNSVSGAEVLRLRGLSKEEARSVLEYWAKSGIVKDKIDARMVDERWALAGGGIIGGLERNSISWRV
ncbi:MAG: hypothetical protein INR71_08485 [Terriglobus roseus]|nr:hypothetical protein [Terriglobus roseus]